MPKTTTAPKTDKETQLARAVLSVMAKNKWSDVTLASVARAAKLSLPEVLAIAPSKTALPGIVLRMLAKEAAHRRQVESASDNPRERLFDITMVWFEVQQSDAIALKKLYRALQYDPATLLCMRGDIVGVAGELLALAEADFGLSARVQAGVFAGVLVRAVSAWREDDEEMGRTMAQLESDLRHLERFFWPMPSKPRSRKPRRR